MAKIPIKQRISAPKPRILMPLSKACPPYSAIYSPKTGTPSSLRFAHKPETGPCLAVSTSRYFRALSILPPYAYAQLIPQVWVVSSSQAH